MRPCSRMVRPDTRACGFGDGHEASRARGSSLDDEMRQPSSVPRPSHDLPLGGSAGCEVVSQHTRCKIRHSTWTARMARVLRPGDSLSASNRTGPSSTLLREGLGYFSLPSLFRDAVQMCSRMVVGKALLRAAGYLSYKYLFYLFSPLALYFGQCLSIFSAPLFSGQPPARLNCRYRSVCMVYRNSEGKKRRLLGRLSIKPLLS